MRVSEYDAFGPWVYMIDEDHPLPSLFAPCVENPEAYRMLFKIPGILNGERPPRTWTSTTMWWA